jgi:hypothetical protein
VLAVTNWLSDAARRAAHGGAVHGTRRGSGGLSEQRETVEAFLAVWRSWEVDGVLEVLDPDLVRHTGEVTADQTTEPRGARRVEDEALKIQRPSVTT